MDAEELAYAGAARQAELIRVGRGFLARAGRAVPRAHRAPQPEAQRVHRGARRARARRRRGRRRAPRRRRRAAAGGPGRDQGQRRRGGDDDVVRDPRLRRRPGPIRRRVRAQVARCRRGGDRQDDAARAGDLRLHRERGLGPDPQPVEHLALARRLERGQRRGGRRRPRGRWPRHRRGRFDPHSGRVLWPLRAQAPARARAARAARPLEPALGQRLREPHGRRHRPLPRRRRAGPTSPRPREPRPAGCASRSRTSPRGRSCRRSSPTRSRPGSRRPSSCCAPSVTTCAATTRASA